MSKLTKFEKWSLWLGCTLIAIPFLVLVVVVDLRTSFRNDYEIYTSDSFCTADIDTAEVYTWSEWYAFDSKVLIDKKNKEISVVYWGSAFDTFETKFDVVETGDWVDESSGHRWLRMAIQSKRSHNKGFCRLVKKNTGQLQIYFDFPDQGRSLLLGNLRYKTPTVMEVWSF